MLAAILMLVAIYIFQNTKKDATAENNVEVSSVLKVVINLTANGNYRSPVTCKVVSSNNVCSSFKICLLTLYMQCYVLQLGAGFLLSKT